LEGMRREGREGKMEVTISTDNELIFAEEVGVCV